MRRRLALAAALLLVPCLAAVPAHAQIAAAVVAPGNDGALHVDENGNGVFAVVAINLGKAPFTLPQSGATFTCGYFEIRANGAVVTQVCQLDTATGACSGPALDALWVFLQHGEVGVYGVLVGGAVDERITVTFTEYTDDLSGLPFHCQCPHPHPLVGERGAVSIQVKRP